MHKKLANKNQNGFSVLELMLAMTLILIVLGLIGSLFSRSITTRQRESSRTDALTAAQAAINVISREVANSGYGLVDNGIVSNDSTLKQLHFRANIENSNLELTDPGEDVTYYFDPVTESILRHDANALGVGVPETSVIVNRISDLNFEYFNYIDDNPIGISSFPPDFDTGRVRVSVKVLLERIEGQVNPQEVVLVSDVTLRNADFMLRQY
jgi:prepilin-type N-terminal cleavage/methylation domain-containing protein